MGKQFCCNFSYIFSPYQLLYLYSIVGPKIKVIYSQSANVDTMLHCKFSVQLNVYLEIPG